MVETKTPQIFDMMEAPKGEPDFYLKTAEWPEGQGRGFHWADPTAWSLKERSRLKALLRRVGELETKDEVTEEDSREYTALWAELVHMAVPELAPIDLRTMGDSRLRTMFLAFFDAAAGNPAMQTIQNTLLSIGRKLSPVSNGTTEPVTPPAGGG